MLPLHLFQGPLAGKRDNVSHWIRVSRRSCDAASRRRRPEVNSPYFAKRACLYTKINALCFGDAAILARFTASSQRFNLFFQYGSRTLNPPPHQKHQVSEFYTKYSYEVVSTIAHTNFQAPAKEMILV